MGRNSRERHKAKRRAAQRRGSERPAGDAADPLGLFGARAFSARVGRNEAFNHAGNAVSAAITRDEYDRYVREGKIRVSGE